MEQGLIITIIGSFSWGSKISIFKIIVCVLWYWNDTSNWNNNLNDMIMIGKWFLVYKCKTNHSLLQHDGTFRYSNNFIGNTSVILMIDFVSWRDTADPQICCNYRVNNESKEKSNN